MTRSFRDPYTRVPNFGVEGAIPKLPWWADVDRWRVVPPASPPWSSPPSVPRDDSDPFGVLPQVPAPQRPRSGDVQHHADSELIDWLLNASRTRRGAPAKRSPSPDQGRSASDLFMDARPWRVIERSRTFYKP